MRTVSGACHAADVILPAYMPDIYNATVNSIHEL